MSMHMADPSSDKFGIILATKSKQIQYVEMDYTNKTLVDLDPTGHVHVIVLTLLSVISLGSVTICGLSRHTQSIFHMFVKPSNC